MLLKTYQTEGVVLKRRNIGEADRVVTIFTKQRGKIVAVAKGVRRITSRRAGSMEPATQAVFFLAKGKTFDVITQVKLIKSFNEAKESLKRVTQVQQILEIVDLITRENQVHQVVYDLLVEVLENLDMPGNKRGEMVDCVRKMLESLGFGVPLDNSELSLKRHLENIVERGLRSKKMLSVNVHGAAERF